MPEWKVTGEQLAVASALVQAGWPEMRVAAAVGIERSTMRFNLRSRKSAAPLVLDADLTKAVGTALVAARYEGRRAAAHALRKAADALDPAVLTVEEQNGNAVMTAKRLPYGYAKRRLLDMKVGESCLALPEHRVAFHNAASRLGMALKAKPVMPLGKPMYRLKRIR